MRRLPSIASALAAGVLGIGWSAAADAAPGYHPHAPAGHGATRTVRSVDLSAASVKLRRQAMAAEASGQHQTAARSWAMLDEIAANPPARSAPAQGSLPEGWVQRGSVVLPAAVASGDIQVDPNVAFAIEDVPGNAYPRKHTLYLNFVGEDLTGGAGDNSAENKSALAKTGPYPAYQGGNQKALSIAQAVADDVEPYGIRVLYLPEDRPSKTVPYTMEMVGGTWQDTNIDSSAGGVAPGADCGALGQRHVVYTFASAGLGVNTAANTASQEAGHAWGLDHTFNCDSVMSYCGVANGNFSDTCDALCELQCQGNNSAGCRLTHEMFCGEDNDEQNEHATLSWIFGTNEPDVEPPTVDIVSPTDGDEYEVGADVDLRAVVGDDYGGFGWKYTISLNGEVIFDEVDYDRQIDDDYRAALNLNNLEEGIWSVSVEVEDQFDHVTVQTVTFTVGDPPPLPEDTGDESSGGTADGTADGIEGMSDGGATDPGGCACDAGGSGRGAPWAVLALLPLLVTPRRRR
ncbi:MAG: MYXO-CTERM sorting domain-containing protein [Myxococcota bacterium]